MHLLRVRHSNSRGLHHKGVLQVFEVCGWQVQPFTGDQIALMGHRAYRLAGESLLLSLLASALLVKLVAGILGMKACHFAMWNTEFVLLLLVSVGCHT